MITIKNLKKTHLNFELRIEKLNFPKKGFVSLIGKSGSGKTTLLNILAFFEKNFSGEVKIFGKNIKKADSESINQIRQNNICYVHQNPILFENLNIYDNFYFFDNKELFDKEKYDDICKKLNLNCHPNTQVKLLSAGERQRISLSRLLIRKYEIVLADEPTGNLDSDNTDYIFKFLKEYSKNSLVIVVSHNIMAVKKYSDIIYEITNGEISKHRETSEIVESAVMKTEKTKLQKGFVQKYVKSAFKSKKYSFLFTKIMGIIAIFSFCLIGIICTSVNQYVSANFIKYFNENQLLIRQKNIPDYIYHKRNSLDLSQAQQLLSSYSTEVEDYGYIYESNFETLFIDGNSLFLNLVNRQISIEGFSARSFNEFLFVKDIMDKTFIYKDDNLLNNEIILSLNINQIENICYELRIIKSKESLFDYIKNNDMNVSLFLKNNDWGYENEEPFKIVGFVVSPYNAIYHSNNLFNVDVFEKMFQLKSTSYVENSVEPWVLKRTFVLKYRKIPISFLNKFNYDKFLCLFYFNRINEKYFKIFDFDELSEFYYFAIYKKSSSFFDTSITGTMISNLPLSIDFSCYGSYVSLGSSIISGFTNLSILSTNLNKNEEIITQIEQAKDINNLYIDEDGLILGGINSSIKNPLRVKNYVDQDILVGSQAKNLDEIVVSQRIFKDLNLSINNCVVYLSCCTAIENNRNLPVYKYKTILLKVVGVVNSNDNLIYNNNFWAKNLFEILFGIDFNFLQVNAIVATFINKNVLESSYKILENSFPNYEFSNPSKQINEKVNNTLLFFGISLGIFSFITLLGSFIIFIFSFANLIDDSKRDLFVLYCNGYSKDDSRYLFKNILNAVLIKIIIFVFFLCVFTILYFNYYFYETLLEINSIYPLAAIFFVILILVILIKYISLKVIDKKIKNLNLVNFIKTN